MIYFDIETAGLDVGEIAVVPEFSAPKSYKDPAKIAAWVETKKYDWEDGRALSPITGYVLCVGIIKGNEDTLHVLEGDEEAVLQDFWAITNDALKNGDRMCGFSIKNFDLPFLIRRSWIHAIPYPSQVFNGRRLSDQFVDPSEYWGCGRYEDHISLRDCAKLFGVGDKGASGKGFAALWSEPASRPGALAYLKNDIVLARALAKRMQLV